MPLTLFAFCRRQSRIPRLSRYLFCVTLICVTAFAERSAWAQSEADRATARNLAAEGYTALKTTDYSTAEDRFRRADALVHAPTLVVDHARALIGLGRFVEAQERLELVLREGVSDNAPWVWKKSIEDSAVLLAEVKPKIAWLTINVSGPATYRVTVDGVEVPTVALGVRRATDPGARRIAVTAHGYTPKVLPVRLPEGGERAISLELSPAPVAKSEAAAPAPASKNVLLNRNAPKAKTNTWAYAALGLGGAGLVVGTVTGLVALDKRTELLDVCPTRKNCPYQATSVHDQYITYGTISGVGWTVGILSGAAGMWLLLDRPKAGQSARQQARVVPYLTYDSVGLTGAF